MRSNFSSSSLVRLLGEWTPVDAQAPGMDFAERLSLWFNAFDAIGLQAAHQSIRAISTSAAAKPPPARPVQRASVDQALQEVRAALAHAIGRALAPPADAADARYAPYRQRHLELQRQMDPMIAALRDQVRQRLCVVSARLRRLATLDGVLEHVIAPREQALLPTVAALMERRFEQRRQAHRQALEAAGQQDDPARWRRPGGWLALFEHDWRQALLAEVDLRLEPVSGLVEALGNESKHRP